MASHAAAGALLDRIRGALWGVYIADALSMPVHWYYDPGALHRDFGEITDYQAPKQRHPTSIMNLSNTGGHGRGGQSERIIGDVINHGKHKFWGVPGMHYHQGMAAGENTLNALCARVVTRGISANAGKYDPERFLKDYVSFMTTPGSHNDTYAESFHRDFFKNWDRGVAPAQCSKGTEGHNTASIGGFVMLPPVVLASAAAHDPGGAVANAITHMRLTHDSSKLAGYARQYAGLLADVVQAPADVEKGELLREAIRPVAQAQRIPLDELTGPGYDDLRVVHRVYGSACYIEDSFPVMLYLAYKHSHSFKEAVLANTNVGGENCHRGAALGALVGAAHGESGIPPELIKGLKEHDAIRDEIDAFCAAVMPLSVGDSCGGS